MSKISFTPNASGTGTLNIVAPNTNTNRTLTLPDITGTLVSTDASGNVGIGTATPNTKLSVEGAINFTAAVATPAVGASIYAPGASQLAFGTSSTESMRIIANGNVGIGTASPSVKLEVFGGRLRINNTSDPGIEIANAGVVKGYVFHSNADDVVNIRHASATYGISVDSGGSVGIGTPYPTAKLAISLVSAPGSSAFAGGSNHLNLFAPTGSGYAEPAIKFQEEGSDVGAVIAGKNVLSGAMAIIFANRPTGSTTSTLVERMRIDPAGLITQLNATSGAGAIVGEQTFRLTANGSTANQGVVTDFFGATSIISLEASSVYQITAYCVFTKNTAGTVAWNMFASSAPTRMVGTYLGSPVTGIAAGAPISGFTGAQGATTATFAATGSLTTAVNHAFQFTMQVQTNAATGFRFQINSITGSATPLAGSYYTVKKISASTGTFT